MLLIRWIPRVFGGQVRAGIFFVLLSYAGFLIPDGYVTGSVALLVAASFYLGFIFVANGIATRLDHESLTRRIFRSVHGKTDFIVFCAVSSLFFQAIGNDFGAFWHFPYWTAGEYWVIGYLLGGWAFYVLFIVTCYEAAKLLLDRARPPLRRVTRYFRHEGRVYNALGLIGALLLLAVCAEALVNTGFLAGFRYDITSAKEAYLGWPYLLAAMLSGIMLAEFVEYRRRRTSLLKDLIHGYWNPLWALLISSLLLGVFNEVQNLNVYLWRYANVPFPDLALLGVPVAVLLGWFLHFALFVELWRAFGTDASRVLFAESGFRTKELPGAPLARAPGGASMDSP